MRSLLLSLLRPIITQKLQPVGHQESGPLKILGNSGDSHFGSKDYSKSQRDLDNPYNNDYYSHLNDYEPRERGEREIQEFEEYEKEKEMPNISKAGLSILSWWKSGPDAKRKNGTYFKSATSRTVDVVHDHRPNHEFISTTCLNGDCNYRATEPSEVSRNIETCADLDAGNKATFSSGNTTRGRYINDATQTECFPRTFGTPATCADLGHGKNRMDDKTNIDISETERFPHRSDTTCADIGVGNSNTVPGRNKIGDKNISDTTDSECSSIMIGTPASCADLDDGNKTPVSENNIRFGMNIADTTLPDFSNQTESASVVKIFQIYRAPITQVFLTPSQSPHRKLSPTQAPHRELEALTLAPNRKSAPTQALPRKSFMRINADSGEPSTLKSKVNQIFHFNDIWLPHNNSNNDNHIYYGTSAIKRVIVNRYKNESGISYVPMTNTTMMYGTMQTINFGYMNATSWITNISNYEAKENVNQISESNNQSEDLNLKNELMSGKEVTPVYKVAIKPIDRKTEKKYPSITDQRKEIAIEQVRKPVSNQSFDEYSNKHAWAETIINKQKNIFDLPSLSAQTSGPLKNLAENSTLENKYSQLFQNEIDAKKKDNFREFIKYNETYLSQSSDNLPNLVALCKNVTCQGNNYLAQCCSRNSPPEKCKGEDFSYLHSIPIETTTATSTEMGKSVANNTFGRNQVNVKYKNYNVDYVWRPKRKNRVIRENEINDFVKFQLMHGMTAPDSKEMKNALKEVSIQMEKVNREFHPNDPEIIQTSDKEQSAHEISMIGKRTLPMKESGFVKNLNTHKILDELRATISNSLLHAHPLREDGYRIIRNQGDQVESIREHNIVLEKLKKEIETEMKRLSLIKMRQREEEILFNRELEKNLNDLKIVQDIIHREFESRTLVDSGGKRAIPGPAQEALLDPRCKESTYSKFVRNIESSVRNNGIGGLFLGGYSTKKGNTSKGIKSNSSSIDVDKFPELEIRSPSSDHQSDDTLVVLNLGTDKDSLSTEKRRKKRQMSSVLKLKFK